MTLFTGQINSTGLVEIIESFEPELEAPRTVTTLDELLVYRQDLYGGEDWFEEFQLAASGILVRGDGGETEFYVEAPSMQRALEKVLRHTGRWEMRN